MIKHNKVRVVVLMLVANLLTVTSVTVQAAAIQEAIDVEAVKMIEESTVVKGHASCIANTMTEDVITQAKAMVEELEVQKQQQELLAQYDLELLASIIFCEAGNQSYEGQVAVGAVIMNRMKSQRFPNTMEEVIYQSGQFTPAMTGWLDSVKASSGYTDSAMQAAKDAVLGVNPVGECLFFDQGGYGYQIGAHYFH